MLAFRKKKMSIDDFNPVRSLGEGAYGEVLLVKLKATKKEYAMKVLDKAHIAKEQKEYQVLIEKQALSKLSHPNFVKLHFSFQVPPAAYSGWRLLVHGAGLCEEWRPA